MRELEGSVGRGSSGVRDGIMEGGDRSWRWERAVRLCLRLEYFCWMERSSSLSELTMPSCVGGSELLSERGVTHFSLPSI